MHRVVTLGFDGSPLFEMGIPARIFGAARAPDGNHLYECSIVAADGSRQLRCREGSLAIERDLTSLREADTVLVASSDELLSSAARKDWAASVREHLGAASSSQPRWAGMCSGAFFLAELGWLEGRRATTHWRLAGELSRTFPDVRVDPGQLYVEDGGVYTSGGVASGIDLCLHLIRLDHGTAIANEVARSCIVAPMREGGQAQFIEAPAGVREGERTSGVAEWLLENLAEQHSLSGMAARAHMSVRTFERHFETEQGDAPGRWLTRARVQLAKELLECTDLSIDMVAQRAGFGTDANLRIHFSRCTGMSPHAYRRQFAVRAD